MTEGLENGEIEKRSSISDGFRKAVKAIAGGSPFQHDIVGSMGRAVADNILSRETGKSEREPVRQNEVSILVKTESGKTICADLRVDSIKIAMDLNEFPRDEVFRALRETYTDFEPHTKIPDYFPKVQEDENFMGLRKPVKKKDPRAYWILIEDNSLETMQMDTLDENAKLEHYWFGQDNMLITLQIEEKDDSTKDESWYTTPYLMELIPGNPGLNFQNKFEKFMGRLLGRDKIASLSIEANGFDVPITPKEAEKYSGGLILEKTQKSISINSGKSEEAIEQTVDVPNKKLGKYIFKMGENEYGILQEKGVGYVLPYIFTKVVLFPEGLFSENLRKELERMRIM